MAEEEVPVSRRESHFGAQRASLVSTASGQSPPRPRRGTTPEASGSGTGDYDIPEGWANLNEISAPSPIQNPHETELYRHRSLEEHVERRRSSARSTWPPPERRRSTTQEAIEEEVAAPEIQRERRRSTIQRRPSRPVVVEDEYTMPENYENLNELAGPSPVENPREEGLYRHITLEDEREESRQRRKSRAASRSKSRSMSKGRSVSMGRRIPMFREKSVDNLDATAAPDAAIDGTPESQGDDLEQARRQQEFFGPSPRRQAASRFATQLYTLSYLVLFSILGTLARLGIQWLTFYPGAPIATPILWANFAGSMFMGFLSEDRRLFRQEWGSNTSFGSTAEKFQMPNYKSNATDSNGNDGSPLSGRNTPPEGPPDEPGRGIFDSEQVVKAHAKVKKTIPLYIGLATGFCGSLTSFSSFLRDAFLALANNLPTPNSHPYPAGSTVPPTTSTVHRNGGYSFMALISVIFMTVIMSMGALKVGAHVAIALDPLTPTLSFRLLRKALDRLVVVVALGAWLGAVFMAIWPPDRFFDRPERWRGEAIMACVFAPLGCLLRFYVSLRLNGLSPAFPLGTFAVNVFGSAILAMCFDLQHVTFQGVAGGSLVGCQVLEGVMDGFCGCLTTVSTWVAELNGLRRTHSYIYGCSSVLAGLSMMVLIMGSVRWSQGWVEPVCAT